MLATLPRVGGQLRATAMALAAVQEHCGLPVSLYTVL